MKMLIKILFLTLISLNSFAEDKVLTFASDPYCPWNCDDPVNKGIAVDILKAIFEPKGYKVEYINMPWTNALKNVRQGKFTGVMIASLNSDTKDFIFPKTAIVDNNTYYAAQNKLSDQIKVVGSINDTHKNYIIFSPALKESQALADMYDEGYKKLLDDGTVQKILVKYDVN
jgi:ABC-type amino acid transport substrate-binding protein